MIFAAGLGTRLRPLTNDRPKALVGLAGKPLLEHVILKMIRAGVDRIVINVHHYADLIGEFLKQRDYFNWDIVVSDERECLLDTGGGLLKARPLFLPGQPVLIHNVDILSELDLEQLIHEHEQRQHSATLVVRPGGAGRGLRFSPAGLLKGWENLDTGEQRIVDDEFYVSRNYSFCGIHIVSSGFLERMEGRGVFSIIDEYLHQAQSTPVNMYFYEGLFLDLGTPESIEKAEKILRR